MFELAQRTRKKKKKAPPAPPPAPIVAKPKTEKLGWHVNMDFCIGCRACEAACKQEFDLPVGIQRRRVIFREGGEYPRPYIHYITISCNHCAEPSCAKVCPVGAYSKRSKDGIVVHDPEKCIGCERCTFACPYGAPRFDKEKKKVDKCSFCLHRIDQGLQPACVQTCMGLALSFGKLDEIDKGAFGPALRSVEGFADPNLTDPSIRFLPPRT